LPFFPLASGLLTGKYLEGFPKNSRLSMPDMKWLKEQKMNDPLQFEKIKKLKVISDDLGISLARMSLAWCLKNPNVSTVILGATRVQQLKENLTAFEAVPMLTDEVMKRIYDVTA